MKVYFIDNKVKRKLRNPYEKELNVVGTSYNMDDSVPKSPTPPPPPPGE